MSRKVIPYKTNIEPRKIVPSNEEIPCSWPDCRQIFFSLKNLEKHPQVYTQGLHKCNLCNRQFQKPYTLNRHIRIHTGEKPFVCSVCSKSFLRLDKLKAHMKIHTERPTFKCRICQKSTMSKLKAHMRFHTGEKPYECKLCGKTFAYSNSLTVHQRIHHGDKPHKCTFCSRSFPQVCNLEDHMRIHTGERPFNCEICSKSFAQRGSLQFYIRKHADKMPRAHSIGGKRDFSKRNKHTRKIAESEEPRNSCNQRAKRMHKEDGGHPNKQVSMALAPTSRMQTTSEKNKQLSLLTCQACYQVTPSLEYLCRHYSLQHNLPKAVMPTLAIPEKIFLLAINNDLLGQNLV